MSMATVRVSTAIIKTQNGGRWERVLAASAWHIDFRWFRSRRFSSEAVLFPPSPSYNSEFNCCMIAKHCMVQYHEGPLSGPLSFFIKFSKFDKKLKYECSTIITAQVTSVIWIVGTLYLWCTKIMRASIKISSEIRTLPLKTITFKIKKMWRRWQFGK